MSEVLIKAEHVSKKFCRSLKRSLWYGLRDIGSEIAGADSNYNRLREDEFWAVKDVSFELRRGECLGLIGRNGAGKTTLLRMLNGLIKPDAGTLSLRGRVGALIALGAGFNPVLSGRENIYINASVLGLSKAEIDKKIEEIIDFAEIRAFIDAPVQNYSSGMQVRLGFAVATALEPDILILDEVLAVGDASFRHKCYHRINKLLANAAVILVSHSMDYIAHLCSDVIVMRKGEGEWFDDSIAGIAAYSKENELTSSTLDGGGRVEAIYPPVLSAQVRLGENEIQYGGAFTLEVDVESAEHVEELILSLSVTNLAGQTVMNWQSDRNSKNISLVRGKQTVRIHISPLLLHQGSYSCDFSAVRPGSLEHCIWFFQVAEFVVRANFRPCGEIPYLPLVEDCEVKVQEVSLGKTLVTT